MSQKPRRVRVPPAPKKPQTFAGFQDELEYSRAKSALEAGYALQNKGNRRAYAKPHEYECVPYGARTCVEVNTLRDLGNGSFQCTTCYEIYLPKHIQAMEKGSHAKNC